MEKSFFAIYKTFFKIGVLLLGGGYVILPLLMSELSHKKGWVSTEELSEYYAISTSLPGVIAINTAIFTGRKIAGFKGEIASVLGVVTPAFLAIIILASVLEGLVGLKIVQYIFWGVGIGVITLLFLAIKEMWRKCITDKYTVFIYVLVLGIALLTKISPALIIIGVIISAVITQIITDMKERKNVK